MTEQMSFSQSGAIAANIAATQPKGVTVGKVISNIRAYVDAMNRMNKRIDKVRIKKDEYRQILDALNKGRNSGDPQYASINWDGIPIVT